MLGLDHDEITDMMLTHQHGSLGNRNCGFNNDDFPIAVFARCHECTPSDWFID